MTSPKPRLLAALGLFLVCAGVAGLAHAGELRVGAARVPITPTPDEFPYTMHNEIPFVGVHDDVYVRALVLDDGQHKLVLVVAEATRFPLADELTGSISKELGVPAANVMLAATHTHSVPMVWMDSDHPTDVQKLELEHIRQGTLQAVRSANAHLRSARIAFGRGQGWININNGEQAGLSDGYDPKGPSDKTLDVVRVTTPDGAPVALLLNYATHAEVMYRSVSKEGGYEVSGDLPGAVSRLLESRADGAPVVLFTSAAEADQLTIFKSLQYAARLPAADAGAAGWALMDAMARRLSKSVLDVVAALDAGSSQVHLSAAREAVSCPGEVHRRDPVTHEITVQEGPPVQIPLSVWRINDQVLAGVGGDVATEIGAHFKQASPLPHPTLITMVGEQVGYIFADASYEHPGHGVMASRLKPGCADHAIVSGLVDLIQNDR